METATTDRLRGREVERVRMSLSISPGSPVRKNERAGEMEISFFSK